MPAQIKTQTPIHFFKGKMGTSFLSAERKLRIVIKEKGGNWQDTVLRCQEGLPAGTEWIMNCFPGSKFPHTLVRSALSNNSMEKLGLSDPELQQLLSALQEHRNTSPIAVSSKRFDLWYRFVNEKLWAKFHKLEDKSLPEVKPDSRLEITAEEWILYQTVNRKYAKALARDIIADVLAYRSIRFDVNWLHDFQLILVFHYLEGYLQKFVKELAYTDSNYVDLRYSKQEQSRLQKALPIAMRAIKTSYFHHIPWPDVDTFKAELPIIAKPLTIENHEESFTSINTGKEIINGLLSSGHVAFQTAKDAKNFLDCVHYYHPDAKIEKIDEKHVKIYLSNKEIDATVNPIGTDHHLFAKDDLSDEGIVRYLSKLLGVKMECLEASDKPTFDLRLAELIQETKRSYYTSLVKLFLQVVKAKPIDITVITELLTLENLREENRSKTKETLCNLLKDSDTENNTLIDNLFDVIQQTELTLEQAHRDLLSDFSSLQQLHQFKSHKPENQLFTSIGRLDPEKNVPLVLDAYLAYLQDCIFHKKPVKNSLLLLIVPSRLEVPAYQEELKIILEKLEGIKEYLKEHGYDADSYIFMAEEDALREAIKKPNILLSKPKLITPNAMTEFYRLGNMIVSSRADGMNLVIKEWVAAQIGIVQQCLTDFFDFLLYQSDSISAQELNTKENTLFAVYAHAFKEHFSHHPELAQILTRLSRNFYAFAEKFFAQYNKPVPLLPMLSQNAGAAEQLKEAFIIDPLDAMSIREKFQQMEELEDISRVARALELKRIVEHENGKEWRRDIIDQVLAEEVLRDTLVQSGLRFAKADGLILIDYDGTVAPLTANPEEAWPDSCAQRAILNLLKISPERLVFITGRDIESFERCFWGGPGGKKLKKLPLTVISSHGIEVTHRDNSRACLLSLNEVEQSFIDKLSTRENITQLKKKIRKILDIHFESMPESHIDKSIEIKKFSICLLTAPLRELVNDKSVLQIIEHQFAELLTDHYLKTEEGEFKKELARFSIWKGIDICELRYNTTKAEAVEKLLAFPDYSTVTHLTFFGDDFGQPYQPGTDYSLAAWINNHNGDPSSRYKGYAIQVIPPNKQETQKQILTSPARPHLVLTSPRRVGEALDQINEYALEVRSRSMLITKAIAQIKEQFPESNILQPSTSKEVALEEVSVTKAVELKSPRGLVTI
ncbi:hypothetical protein A8135_09465 [Legionella jamestowniensis]|uniref:Uncharacterized protein n=1 Tax=Legionella jamestowniensis TaxID=455 RepID=A0ABX2XWE7_9GAMM|nr:trehalose-phosphatase [Legionella jamestowniensis]OCH98973.1 hypothetical protein A8135_09465 [Legionella jamestowniensis]